MIWDLPNKEKYLIVGCGQSAEKAQPFLSENPDFGIITVNMSISGFEHVDIACFMHYEPILWGMDYFDRADHIFIPNPNHLGWGQWMTAEQLYSPQMISDPKIHIYERCDNQDVVTLDDAKLFNRTTVATAGLTLVWKMGLKEIWTAGIGGEDDPRTYNYNVCWYPRYAREGNSSFAYEDMQADFQIACDKWDIGWVRL